MSVPTIDQLPIAPQVTDAPTVFSSRANSFVAALSTLVTQTNATVGEINQALAGALVQFNAYQGDWEEGSYALGDVVRKDEVFYISLANSNQEEPPSANWQELGTAQSVSFDNAQSGSAAVNVQQALDQIFSSLIPSGIVAMWSGAINEVPDGWALCDGQNGTPDLRDRFVVGAGSSYSSGQTGGSKDAVLVAHNHSVSGGTNTAGNHTHTVGDLVQNRSGGQNYSGGNFGVTSFLSTSAAGAHSHSVSGSTNTVGESGSDKNLPPYLALAYIMKL